MGPRHLCRGNSSHGSPRSYSHPGSQCERLCPHTAPSPFQTTFITSSLKITASNSATYNVASAARGSANIRPLAPGGKWKPLHHLCLPRNLREPLAQRFDTLNRPSLRRTQVDNQHMVLLMIDHLDQRCLPLDDIHVRQLTLKDRKLQMRAEPLHRLIHS